jgi:hypothetical protein
VNMRELNEWIAVYVMDWKRGNMEWGRYPWTTPDGQHLLACKPFSTDISAAMEVVAKMRERGSEYFELTQQPDGEWFAEFSLRGESFERWAATPALAICLAAQAAITAEGAK